MRTLWTIAQVSAALLAVLAVINTTSSSYAAGEAGSVDRIEEDWELVVTSPDATTTAPQVSCVISPTGNVDGVYAIFELNHRTQPDFSGGGMQLQVWNGETPWAHHNGPSQSSLTHEGETIRWTQRVSLNDGSLVFDIVNGTSQTWGAFGGQGYLRHTTPSGLSSLSGYQSSVSTSNSGVGFAGNRVSRLALKEVRYYSGADLVQQVTTEQVVHELQ